MSISTLDRISAGAPAEAPFAALRGRQFIKLTTYRKTGKPVPTTVWFAEETYCQHERPRAKRRARNPVELGAAQR